MLRFLPLVAVICGVVSLAVLLVQAPRIWQQIDQLNTAEVQIVHRGAHQLEAAYLEFKLSVLRAVEENDEDLGVLRLRHADLRKQTEGLALTVKGQGSSHNGAILAETLSALDAFATESAAIARLIDANDPELIAVLPSVLSQVEELRFALRGVTDAADRMVRLHDERTQRSLGAALLSLVLAALVLFVSTALLASVFWRLYRINLQRARENRLVSARLETVVETSQDAIIVTDDTGVITGFNRAAETIFGMASSIARGRPINDLVFETDGRSLSLERMAKAPVERVQMTARDAVSRNFPVEVSLGTALRDGNRIHVFFLRDISTRLAVEADLRASRDRALASERAKAHFLAVMSHEMRTPLTGILGAIELLRTNSAAADRKEYLNILQSSGELLLGHINDVLDLTEIESMGINLTERAFDIDALLDEVLRSLKPSADRQSSRLVLMKSADRLGWFKGDPVRIRQILINLIGNAINFTRDGEVSVEASVVPDTEGLVLGRHRIEIQIADTGTGIPKNQLDRIFEDFVRLEDTATRRTEGTGLGLGIVKRLVGAMGGRLGAESVEGEGSLFWFSLSLAAVEQPAVADATAAKAGTVPRSSVLIVEDNAINRFILREMLQRDGHSVAEAADGREGVDMAEAEAFDLILMDINMPRMNGLQAAQAIRAGKGKSAGARIVALTAHVFDHDQRRFKDAGMDDIVIKPLRWDGLRRVIKGNPAAVTVTRATEQPANGAGVPVPPLIDRDVLTLLQDTLGPVQLGQLLDQFMSEADTSLSGIRQGLNAPRQVLRDRLHGFSGPAATFGARRLHSLLGTLEEEVLEMPAAELARMPDRLETLWTATRKEVRAIRLLLPAPSRTTEIRPTGPQRDANDPRRLI